MPETEVREQVIGLSRRSFFGVTLASTAGVIFRPERTWGDTKDANSKLDIACIGVGGRGAANVQGLAKTGHNIVALCDVDDKMGAKMYDAFPEAQRFNDFRKMLETVKGIDAVVVSTPDHTHAVASVMAMRMGKHVYCEKPLTHSVHEARLMRQLAADNKLCTQMGNQGTAGSGLRQAVEIVWSGAIGHVKEVHCWTNRPVWPQGHRRPGEEPVPAHFNYDVWLGPAPQKPYGKDIHPFKWRGYWDYGTGALGDMACHTANMAFMACKLGYPVSVEAVSGEINPDTYPVWATVTYEFPARDGLPPLKWTWYEGKRNGQQNLPPEDLVAKLPKEKTKDGKERLATSGSLLVGEKGMLYSPSDYGASYVLLPKEDFNGYKPPAPSLPRSPGHYEEWVTAITTGKPGAAMSNFDYAAFLTEVVVLGNVAVKLQKKVEWDGPNMKCSNLSEAAALICPEYRKGWSL